MGQDIESQRSQVRLLKRQLDGLKGAAGHPRGLEQALFQKRGLVGLECGLRGGDIGGGLAPRREKIVSEPSFGWKSGRRGRLEVWEALGDGAARDGREISGCWRVLKSSSDDVGNFINESLLGISEKG